MKLLIMLIIRSPIRIYTQYQTKKLLGISFPTVNRKLFSFTFRLFTLALRTAELHPESSQHECNGDWMVNWQPWPAEIFHQTFRIGFV